WILRREWRQFRSIRWWLVLAGIALFTLPELYCLYMQFDLHPEKQVFGHTAVSGIRFFFWDSQFGRFFNTGPIKGNGDPFFYFHTLLWAFLPWSLLLYAAVIKKCRAAVRTASSAYLRRALNGTEPTAPAGDYCCLGAALVSFALFSLSRFQLPHYLNILFPFFSILTAAWLCRVSLPLTDKVIRITQGVINILLPVLVLFLCWWFHFNGWPFIAAVILFLSLLPFLLFGGRQLPAAVLRSCAMALVACTFVNFELYPAILRYQAGTQAGRFIGSRQSALPAGVIYTLEEGPANYSFEFYCPYPVQRISMDSLRTVVSLRSLPTLVFTPSSLADSLRTKGFPVNILRQFPNFHVSRLTGDFIDYRTRISTLESYTLLEIRRQARSEFDTPPIKSPAGP
ncbi:MAG TPA: hypothetical protein VNU72_06240, partial [Puia sp.]|nr:hypothetical protein [Puia sp.]